MVRSEEAHIPSVLTLSPCILSDLMNYEFDRVDLVTLALCAGIGVWYLTKKVRLEKSISR